MRTIQYILPLAFALLFMSTVCAEEAKKDAPKGTDVSLEGAVSNAGGQTILKVKDDKATKQYTLWAKDDVAKQLADLVKDHKKNQDVKVNGTLAADGVNIQVTSVSEGEGKKKGK